MQSKRYTFLFLAGAILCIGGIAVASTLSQREKDTVEDTQNSVVTSPVTQSGTVVQEATSASLISPAITERENKKGLSQVIPETLPLGWEREPNNSVENQNIYRKVTLDSNITHVIGIQNTQETEYLYSAEVRKNNVVIKKTKTSGGTEVYIMKSPHNVYVSACPVNNGEGCSLKWEGKNIYISLRSTQPGDQAPGELDFEDPETNKSIDALIQLVEGLKL